MLHLCCYKLKQMDKTGGPFLGIEQNQRVNKLQRNRRKKNYVARHGNTPAKLRGTWSQVPHPGAFFGVSPKL